MDVELGWAEANYLHMWDFHETKLDAEDVKRRVPMIMRLIRLTEEALLEKKQNKD